ncbi:MAG: alpha-E domain-containing protein [Pseudomonadota bacterium]
MLSRTAESLFWMARYMERAETLARLLDAGRRFAALPAGPGGEASEWASIVIASGCSVTYPRPLEEADAQSVLHHLVFDIDNPSSIYRCLQQARDNCRAVRTAVTSEVWDAVNDSWIGIREMEAEEAAAGRLAGFLEWTKARGAHFRGSVESSQLRNTGHAFLRLGTQIERADATARLLDVKYHVLLPADQRVGGGLDYLQWVQILRAVNSRRAFRWVYRSEVRPDRVTHFLILNPENPRALVTCYEIIVRQLDRLGLSHTDRLGARAMARSIYAALLEGSVDEIFAFGLHEWLTKFIGDNNQVALAIAGDYGFGAITIPHETVSEG